MRFETVSGKARIAANSRTIGKIRNAAGDRFGLIDAVHELIRGSLKVFEHGFGRAHFEFSRCFDMELGHDAVIDDDSESLASRAHAKPAGVEFEAQCLAISPIAVSEH